MPKFRDIIFAVVNTANFARKIIPNRIKIELVASCNLFDFGFRQNVCNGNISTVADLSVCRCPHDVKLYISPFCLGNNSQNFCKIAFGKKRIIREVRPQD